MDFPSFSGHGIPYFQADVLLSQSLGSDPSRSLVLVIDLSPKMDTWPKVEKENALFSSFGHKIGKMFSPKPSVTIILSRGNKWTKKERLVKKKKKHTERWEILPEKPLSWLVPFSGLQFLVCDGPRFAWCASQSLQWILVLTGFALSAYYQEFPCGFWPFNKWVRMAKSSSQEFLSREF